MANRWLGRSFTAIVVLAATQPVGAQFAYEPKKSASVGQVTELPPPAEKKGPSFADQGGAMIAPPHQSGELPGPAGSGGSPASSTIPARWKAWWRNLLGCDQAVPSRPLGDAVHETFQIQVDNGVQARLVLRDYDFLPGSHELNCRGKDRVAWIARVVALHPSPVIVERTPANPILAQNRRLAVLQELGLYHPVPANMVVVGVPISAGLVGRDAEILYQRLLYQTQSGGNPQYGGGGAGSTGGLAPFGPDTGGFAPVPNPAGH